MKKIFMIIASYFLSVYVTFAATRSTGASLQSEIVDGLAAKGGTTSGGSLASVFAWAKEELFTITFVIAVGAIVYIGIRMVLAMGKPDEFKKAWMHFVYVILGIFLVYASLGIISLVSNLGKTF